MSLLFLPLLPTSALLASHLAPETCFAWPAGLPPLRSCDLGPADTSAGTSVRSAIGVQFVLADPDLCCLAGASADSCCLSQDLGFRFGGGLIVRLDRSLVKSPITSLHTTRIIAKFGRSPEAASLPEANTTRRLHSAAQPQA